MDGFRDDSVKIFIVSHGEVDTSNPPFPVQKNDLVLHTGHLYKGVYNSRTSETVALFQRDFINTTFQYLKGEQNQKTSPSTVIKYLGVFSESELCPEKIHSYTQQDKDTRPYTGWGIHILTDTDEAISIEDRIPTENLLMRIGGVRTSELITHVRNYIPRDMRVIFTFVSCAVVRDRTAVSHQLHTAATSKSHYTVKPSLTGENSFGLTSTVGRPKYALTSGNLSSGVFHSSALGLNYREKEEENSENENVPARPYNPLPKQYEVRIKKTSGTNIPVHAESNDYDTNDINSVAHFLSGREFQNARMGEEAKGSQYYVKVITRKSNAAGRLEISSKQYPIDTFLRLYQAKQDKLESERQEREKEAQERFHHRFHGTGPYAPKAAIAAVALAAEKEKTFCERCTNAVCAWFCSNKKKNGGRRKTRKQRKLKARKTKHKKQ